MSSKLKEDALNFLLDEFFIYHGLEDLEKHSTNQVNSLESLMQASYELLNQIYKIKLNIKITEKVNQKKNISSIKRYTYAYNKNKKKKNISNDVKKDKELINKDINRNSFVIQKCIKQIDINSLCFKKSGENSHLKKDKSCNFTHVDNIQKIRIKNLKKQISPDFEHKNKIINNANNYMSDKNIKLKGRNRNKKIAIRHFSISLLD